MAQQPDRPLRAQGPNPTTYYTLGVGREELGTRARLIDFPAAED